MVPLVDLSLPEKEASDLIREACTELGFFYGEISGRKNQYRYQEQWIEWEHGE